MKPTNFLQTVFLFSIFFCVSFASAQAPNKMSYQAVVRNASNALIANANVGIQISILQTSITGTAVFVERHTTTTNQNGLATIEIGGGTIVSGNFTTVDWANGPFFIKTQTDPTGGTNYTISGTSQLLSVPFALFAANSGGSTSSWSTNGNSATATTFLGSTNDQDVVFKRDGILAGRLGDQNFANTSFGVTALSVNAGGSNTAFGVAALELNSTGNFNTAVGVLGLGRNTTGERNTASGAFVLSKNTTGSSNTATGFRTLENNTTGGSNTAAGSLALDSNTTGSDNTAMGVGTLDDNIAGVGNTAIGRDALSNCTGNSNTALGSNTLVTVTTGSSNTAIGFNAQVANATGSNQLRLGNTAVTLVSAQVALTTTSDKHWKSNIQPSNLGLDFIKQLNPVFYTRKDVQITEGKTTVLESTTNKNTEYGFIAQELEATLNKFDAKNNGIISKGDDGMYGVRYNDLLAPMVKAIQEQQILIEALTKKIAELEANQKK